MFEKIKIFSKRYDELNNRLYDPSVAADPNEYSKVMKEVKSIEAIVLKYREYKEILKAMDEAREIIEDSSSDKDFREMAMSEIDDCKEKLPEITEELKILLLPKDPNDSRNVIMEIRGGAGGEEAALFCGVLYRMYSMFAEKQGYKTEIINANETELGGFKEISFMINGEGAYSKLKFERGVHRVQRVPETESAIRITHIPTGVVVECQDERSQYKNKDKAMKVLKSRLLQAKREEQEDSIAAERKQQVGTGDRSERIRTYNYPQGRVTDHRIGLTLYKIDDILNGNIEEIVDALIAAHRAKQLQQSMEENN